MNQISLNFNTTKENKKSVKKENTKNYQFLISRKIPVLKVNPLESNLSGFEKIRKKQFPSEVFNIEVPEILNPQEISSIYYISFLKDINKERIKQYIENSIKKIKNTILSENIEYDFKKLDSLAKELLSDKENAFQEFLDEYESLYSFLNLKEKPPANELLKYSGIFSIIPIHVLEKEKISFFTNRISPIMKTLSGKNLKIFFTEEEYLKSYIGSNIGEKIGESFIKKLKDIKDNSIDLSLLFIKENQVKISKEEDILHIRKNTISKKLIEKEHAKEGIITHEAIHPKMKNFGLTIAIGPSHILSNKKLTFKKHEIVAVPLLTIYFFEKKKKTAMNTNVIDLNGNTVEKTVNQAISIYCTMNEKDFMKSPIKQNNPPIFLENIEDINKIKTTPIYQEILKEIEIINKIRIADSFKKTFISIASDIYTQYKRKDSNLLTSILQELINKIEKEDPLSLNTNFYIHELIKCTKEKNRIQNLFKIHLIKKSKETILNPQKEKEEKEIKELAEKVFLKLKKNQHLTLYHIKIISKLIHEEMIENIPHIYEITSGGLFKSEGQTKYVKPFEFLFNKNDFINLCLHISYDYKRRHAIIKYLKNVLKEIREIKSTPQPKLEETNKELLYSINEITKKKFKNINSALEYLFSYNETKLIDNKKLLYLIKNCKNEEVNLFLQMIKVLNNGGYEKIKRQNSMSKIYSEIPSIIQKMKDILAYIENKENIVTKVTIKKTLQKINEIEEELKQ